MVLAKLDTLRALVLAASAWMLASSLQAQDPVVLIHGLNSSSKTWAAFRKDRGSEGWTTGGNLDLTDAAVRAELKKAYDRNIIPAVRGVQRARLYTLDFSSNQGLTIQQQGDELAWVVHAVKKVTGSPKVVLFGHSMGGLAARDYLQRYHRDDVSALVTVGTPHAGSILAYAEAYLRDNPSDRGAKSLKEAIDQFGVLDLGSVAVRELAPGSDGLRGLQGMKLPKDVFYICVVGNSNSEISESIAERYYKVFSKHHEASGSPYSSKLMRSFSDGIVPVVSQYLFAVYPQVGHRHEEIFSTFSHTSQTRDLKVLQEALELATAARKTSWISIVSADPAEGSPLVFGKETTFTMEVEYNISDAKGETSVALDIKESTYLSRKDQKPIKGGTGRVTISCSYPAGYSKHKPFTLVISLLSNKGGEKYDILDRKSVAFK